VLISADYSQIEFRVLAHLAGDEFLIEAFREGADFHEQTALKIFGANSGRDPHALRGTAKMVNYALLYGKTAFTLAKDIGVTPQAAQEFIDAYFAGFPRVRAFLDRTLEEARATVAANSKKLRGTTVAQETRVAVREQHRLVGDWEAEVELARQTAAINRERHGLRRD